MTVRSGADFVLVTAVALLFTMAIGVPAASAGERILSHELEYKGAFRLPGDMSSSSAWPWGGGGMTFRPGGDPSGADDGFPGSLFIEGKAEVVAEVTIPVPGSSPDFDGDDLPRGEMLQGFADVTGGMRAGVAGVDRLGDIAYVPARSGQSPKLYWTVYEYYNVSGENYLSHGASELTLSDPRPTGVWRLGSEADVNYHAMKTSDYIFPIDEEWAEANVGGKMLLSGRHRPNGAFGGAQGPALYAFAPVDGAMPATGGALEATCLVMYPTDGDYFPDYCADDKWSGGAWLKAGDRDAVLVIGSKGKGEERYGDGLPGDCSAAKGFHCDPYEPQFLFYSPDDLAAVARGERQPWEVLPYETYVPDDVFWPRCRMSPASCAYDPATGNLYVLQYNGAAMDYGVMVPIVHVWTVSGVPLPPPDDGGDDDGSGGDDGDDGDPRPIRRPTGEALLDDMVLITPNPTTDVTTVLIDDIFEGQIRRTSVHDLTGRLVTDLRMGSSGMVQWDARRASAGIYFVRVESTHGEVVTKKVSRLR